MKKSYIIGLCAVLMVAIVGCESKDVGTVSSPDSSVTESQPNETQIKFDEERETIKDEAIEADIIQIASGEWEGKKVYGQGQVGLVKESDGEVTFMLVDFSDSSMSGFPVTADANLNKSFLKISNGDMVKIYGTVMPEKNSTSRVFALLIEPLEGTESQESNSSQPTAEDDLKIATEKAKEIAENSEIVKIEDGLIYKNIIALHEKLEVFEMRDKVTQKAASINVKYFTDETDKSTNVNNFMNFIEQAYTENNLESTEYSSFGFEMHGVLGLICMTTFVKDENGGISTSSPLVIDDEYKALFEEEYNKRGFFMGKDIIETFEQKNTDTLAGLLR